MESDDFEWLFMLGVVLAATWLVCVGMFVRTMRERHPQEFEEMGLARMFPGNLRGWLRSHDNSRPAMAMLRFLWRGDFERFGDPALTRLANTMRGVGVAFVAVFAIQFYLGFSETRDGRQAQPRASTAGNVKMRPTSCTSNGDTRRPGSSTTGSSRRTPRTWIRSTGAPSCAVTRAGPTRPSSTCAR
jgi:hypothetical protein